MGHPGAPPGGGSGARGASGEGAARLDALRRYDILDTPPETAFDDIAHLAAQVCQTRVAAVGFADGARIWLKARVGLDLRELPVEVWPCGGEMLRHDLLMVPDMAEDERCRRSRLVAGGPGLRLFACARLATAEGLVLGAVCVMDPVRRQLASAEQDGLRALTRQAMALLELRRTRAEQARELEERTRIEAVLREREERLRVAYENVQVGIAEVDMDGRFRLVNEAFCRITGYNRDELLALSFADITHPDDVPSSLEGLHRLRAGQIDFFREEKRYIRKDGRPIWVSLNSSAVRGPRGRALYYLTAILDVSKRKQAEAHRELLMHELNHRVRNTLMTVQSMVDYTLRMSTSPDAFRAALKGRLHALAATHTLLTRGKWRGASLHALVRSEMAPHRPPDGAGIAISGPDIVLNPEATLSLGLMLHELATNAAKYGALAKPEGRIAVAWQRVASAEGPRLRLRWTETDGPLVGPPRHRGFGSRLIERSAAYELEGTARLEFRPAGVRCIIEFPLAGNIAPIGSA